MEIKDINREAKQIILFFLISHGLPFLVTIVLMFLEKNFYISNQFYSNLIYFSLLSPTLATFFVLYFFSSSKGRIGYWYSLVDPKRISNKWYFIIFCLPVLIRLTAAILEAVLPARQFQFAFSPEMTLSYAIVLLFFGPIPEEMGWRGVAFPKLQNQFGFNPATMILGFMWAIWHLPLFFVEGTYQYQLGLGSSLFWSFMFGIFFTTFIYSMIYNKTNHSILAVILFHFMDNLSGESFIISENALFISTILRGIIAFYIFIYQKKTTNMSEKGVFRSFSGELTKRLE